MKIIVMGGAGDVGSRAVEELVITPGVDLVTIGDCNAQVAGELAANLDGRGATVDVKQVNADHHEDLVAAMKGYDVVASALGPFHRFEGKLVKAAIEAGVNYASVCDDWNAAEDVLEEFDGAARDKGRIILSGLGTSPGFTNVGIRYFKEQMDHLRRADIYVYQPLNAGGGPAVIRHMLFIMTGKVAAWRNGKKYMDRACSRTRRIEFPQYGKIRLWNMGHAEPVSVPRFIPEIEEVNFFMGYGTGARLFVVPSQLGVFKNPKMVDSAVKLVEFIENIAPDEEPAHGAVRIDVWGTKDGQEVHHMLCGTGEMREATGVSLAIGTIMLARGELLISDGGVYAPEAVLDPRRFIDYMKEKGQNAYSDLEMTKPLE